ncbi:MAG: exodeoxyribonuclease V subunit gamma, partial [Planctomycetota bacterium]
PTSRWLGEQIALDGGIAANLRFPFPASRLRELVDQLLAGDGGDAEGTAAPAGTDPWRAQNLVWPVLELLPTLLQAPEAAPLRQWLERRGADRRVLDGPQWQLGRALADGGCLPRDDPRRVAVATAVGRRGGADRREGDRGTEEGRGQGQAHRVSGVACAGPGHARRNGPSLPGQARSFTG